MYVTPETINDSSPDVSRKDKGTPSRFTSFYARNFVVLIAITLVVLGVIARILTARSPLGKASPLNALSLLMGRDFAHGHVSIFRYGHNFAGTLEYLIITPVTAVAGMSTFTTRVVPLAFFVAASFVLWRAFVNTPYKNAMRIVMGVLWMWPALMIFTSITLTGYLGAYQLLFVSALASAYYAAHSLRNLRYFYVWALLSGMLFWTSWFSIFATLTMGYWIIASAPTLKKKRFHAFGIFLIGSLPVWISLFTEKMEHVTHMYSKSSAAHSVQSENTWEAFLQFVGIRTFTRNHPTNNYLSPFFVALLVICLVGIFVLAWLGTSRIGKLKKTDFAFLQILLVGTYFAVGAIYFFLSIKIEASFFVVLAVPLAFITLFARDSKVVISLGIACLFGIGSLSLYASAHDHDPSVRAAVISASSVLRDHDITRAVAPEDLAYLLTVKNKDAIVVTPFNHNNFDQRRSNKVSRDLQGIVVHIDNKEQQDAVLCTQARLKTPFTRITSGDVDVFVVPQDSRARAWKTLYDCVNS